MKKYLFIMLSVALAFAGCTTFATDPAIEFGPVSKPDVTISVVNDNAVAFSVSPKEGTGFYSFAVIEGAAGELDAETLLKGRYKDYAIDGTACGVMDFKKTASVSGEVGGLTPNTAYTVYAVANNSQGVVSEVAFSTVTTTDGTLPGLADYDSSVKENKMMFAVVFNDPVSLTGKGSVTAHFYAINTPADASGNLAEYKTVDVPASNLFTDGEVLYVSIPETEYIPGAYVIITYTDGVVANGTGLENVALIANSFNQKTGPAGICERYAAVNFALSVTEDSPTPGTGGIDDGSDEPEEEAAVLFTDWKSLVMVSYSGSEYPLAALSKTAELSISVADAGGRTVSYSGKQLEIASARTLEARLDEEPGFGTTVSYTIAAGSVEDIFGNRNSELVVKDGYFCSYGYKLEDIAGKYRLTSGSGFTGKLYENILTISESDDEAEGNIMITGEIVDVPVRIYADFDMDNGTVTLPSMPLAGTCTDLVYGDDNQPLTDDEGNYITDEFGVILALTSNAQSFYRDEMGFDVPAAHQLDFWYSQLYVALVEVDANGDLYGVYDALRFMDIEYISGTDAAAAKTAKTVKSVPRLAQRTGSMELAALPL